MEEQSSNSLKWDIPLGKNTNFLFVSDLIEVKYKRKREELSKLLKRKKEKVETKRKATCKLLKRKDIKLK